MLKKCNILLVICTLCISFSCQNKQVDFSVGVCFDVLSDEQSYDFAQHIKKRVEELDGQAIIRTARGSHQRQLDQAQKLINSGIKILVIKAVDQQKAADIVEYAHLHKVKVIAYDKLILNCDLDYMVSYDYRLIGQRQAQAMAEIEPRGSYVLLGGPAGNRNVYAARKGQLSALKKDIKRKRITIILDTVAPNPDHETGYKIARRLLENGKIFDAVLASNDELAGGAIQALQEAVGSDGLSLAGKILVAGVDAETLALRRIDRGLQTFTIYKPVKVASYTVARIAFLFATKQVVKGTVSFIHNKSKKVPATFIPTILVSRENSQIVESD